MVTSLMGRRVLPASALDAPLVTVPMLRGRGVVAPLLELLGGRGWIAGGFARWCCSPNKMTPPPGDLDVFFGDDDSFTRALADAIRLGAVITDEKSYFAQLDVSAAFPGVGLPHVQFIKPFVSGGRTWGPDKEDVVRQIDISVCRIALDGMSATTATADSTFLADESEQRIQIRLVNDPYSVTKHVIKYIRKGYAITPEEMTSIYDKWAEMDEAQRAARRASGHTGY